MSGSSPVLARLLAEVRAGSAQHRRAWERGSDPDAPPPWSAADEDALCGFDLRSLASAAAELDRLRGQLREVGVELDRLTRETIGDPAVTFCARLAATSHERADAAEALVGELRGAVDRAGELLDVVARRVLRSLDADDHPPPGGGLPGGRITSGGAVRGASRDDPSPGYLTLLWTLRAELAEALGSWAESTDPPTPRSGRIPEPGTGPLLPGTESRRVEPGYGIRVARLPGDHPPG